MLETSIYNSRSRTKYHHFNFHIHEYDSQFSGFFKYSILFLPFVLTTALCLLPTFIRLLSTTYYHQQCAMAPAL